MLEIILASFSIFGLFGVGLILFKKVQIIAGMPEAELSKISLVSTFKDEVRKGLRKIPGAEKFDYELYLQKMLSKVRVITLKAEGKTENWLERLRKRRNGHNHDSSYWEELKKAKDGK